MFDVEYGLFDKLSTYSNFIQNSDNLMTYLTQLSTPESLATYFLISNVIDHDRGYIFLQLYQHLSLLDQSSLLVAAL